MSENLKRSNPDFSKYDSMSIGELEEILRADAQGPERDDSDVDEILYVMEVLAKKRRQNGIAGKTALEAYQEFQQHYLPIVVIDKTPKQETFLAVYTNNNTIIKISVQSFLCGYPEQVEMSEGFQEIYSRNGIDYYIFCNHNQNQVVWIVDEYECYISGAVSVDTLKNLIDSIEKG